MERSASLPSVVAVFSPLGLGAGCRVVCVAPSRPLRPHLLCRHNGVRILLGGLAHWRVRSNNGVVRGLDETKAATKSRRRTKKAPSEGEGTNPSVRLDVSDGAESDSGQSASSDSAAPASKRKSSARGRKSKVEDDAVLRERQDAETQVEVSANGADMRASQEPDAKSGARRRRRSSAKSGGAGKPETNGKPLQVSETQVDGNGIVKEHRHSNIEPQADIDTKKKELATPSATRSRRRRKAAAKSPDAPANGSVAAAVDVEDAIASTREPEHSATEDVSLGLSSTRKHEHEDLGLAEEASGSVVVAEADTDPAKGSRTRRKRGKAATNVKVPNDEELQIRVQETAVPSLNGRAVSEVVNGGESAAGAEIQSPSVDVKKKRQRKTRKKPVAVAELDDNVPETSDAAGSGSEEDEAVSSHVPESEEPPPPRKSARRRRRDATKLAAAQAEGEDTDAASESGAVMRNVSSMDTPQAGALWTGAQVDLDGGVSRVQFPAPTWGPQWWEEIQSKPQATISFQDIAERKEGFQARAKVPQEPVSEDGETVDTQGLAEKRAEMTESAEQKIDSTNKDSDVLNKGESAIRSNKDEIKSRRRIAKLHPAQRSPQESSEDWLKRKMLELGKPTEEPWLLESMIAAEAEQETSQKQVEVVEAPASNEEPRKGVPSSNEKEPEVEVEILINTSECTMQRMAILENKKLVEFSIEPVNTKVQVGNIYLGRVKQLLPGMSGVFVDIGGSRLALLDIARNQYPYTFPPVFSSEKNSVNGASLEDEDLGLSEEEADYTEGEDDEDEDERSEDMDGVSVEAEDSDDSEDEVKPVSKAWRPHKQGGPITVNFGRKFSKWRNVEIGMPIIVQVKKESMGKKGPRLTAFPSLAGRFWVLIPRGNAVGVSARITGPERRRLKLLAQALQPQDLGITVRTEAIGHEQEELERDLTRLMDTWKEIMEKAAAAALAVERGEEAAVPVLLHREMGQTLTIIRDLFTEKISRLVVDSPQSHQEVINYLQEVAPHLISRVVLYTGKVPIFDKFNVEVDLERFSSERVKLPNGGYLVLQETEALVSIDVNGGTGMLGHSTKQREAILEVNLAAARQIASEIRLRDIGGIIVVDFIDMDNAEDERLVHEEMRKAIQRDRSKVSLSEISEFGLMEMTRKRVRSSVTLTIHSTCNTCKGTGRVEALETTLSKIERAIRRLLAEHPELGELSSDASTWPQVLLRVEPSMLEFLKSWKKKRIVQMGHSLKVWISLKAGMELTRGQFEVAIRHYSKRPSGEQTSLQQEKAVTAPVLGKRVWPKRKRFFS